MRASRIGARELGNVNPLFEQYWSMKPIVSALGRPKLPLSTLPYRGFAKCQVFGRDCGGDWDGNFP